MNSLTALYQTIQERKENPIEGSYTDYLFMQGLDKILKKCGEEASEVIIAAKNQDSQELVAEMSDLLYHLLVLLNEQSIPLSAIEAELVERQGKISKTDGRKEIKKW